MTYNLHPIIVHFPIAFLFIYSLIKILPMSRWIPRVAWKDIERILLSVGVAGAFVALSTGETAEHITRPDRALVEMHSLFASLSTWLYGALLLGEAMTIFNNSRIAQNTTFAWLLPVTKFLERVLTNNVFSAVLALVALVCIAITGMLGGVIVYGTSADPFAAGVLRLLGISL